MGAKFQVSDLKDVPEAQRPFYVESEDDEGNTIFEFNIDAATRKLGDFDKTVDQRQTARKELSELKALLNGKEPKEMMARLVELETAEKERSKDKATKKGDFDKLKQELDAEHEKEKTEWAQERKELHQAIEDALIDTQAMSELNAKGAKAKALLPHVRSAVRVVRLENGKRVVRVLDPESSGDEESYRTWFKTSEPMTIANLLEEMAEDDEFKPLFPGDEGAGAGVPPKASASGAADVLKGAGQHVIAREDAKDPAKYRAAKEQAEKVGAELAIAED
jgi:hypothetical protein